jgi:hypothetical protein
LRPQTSFARETTAEGMSGITCQRLNRVAPQEKSAAAEENLTRREEEKGEEEKGVTARRPRPAAPHPDINESLSMLLHSSSVGRRAEGSQWPERKRERKEGRKRKLFFLRERDCV